MGFSSVPGSQSATQIRDALQTLSGSNRLDGASIKNLPATGLPPWQLKTSDYTAVSSDRIRAQLSASDLTILLPTTPAIGDEIEIQRLDVTANNLIIDPNGYNLKSQAGKQGLLNSGNIGLAEKISFVNNTIGWLPQSDLLTYRNPPAAPTPPPPFANVGLLLHFDTNFSDSSAYAHTITPVGDLAISTSQSQWGGGSAYYDGTGDQFTIPNHTVFDRGTGDFSWEFWIRTDTGSTLVHRNIFNAPTGATGLGISSTGRLSWWQDGPGNLILGTPPIITENVWHYIGLSRSGTTTTVWLDNELYQTIVGNSQTYDFRGWLSGSNQFNSNFKGYQDDIRFTTTALAFTGAPSAAFPNS